MPKLEKTIICDTEYTVWWDYTEDDDLDDICIKFEDSQHLVLNIYLKYLISDFNGVLTELKSILEKESNDEVFSIFVEYIIKFLFDIEMCFSA